VHEHVGRVGINAEGAGALQLFLRVAATEEAYRESALAAGGENVPNTVTRHDAVFDGHSEAGGSQNENIRRGLGVGDIVSGDERDFS